MLKINNQHTLGRAFFYVGTAVTQASEPECKVEREREREREDRDTFCFLIFIKEISLNHDVQGAKVLM